MGLPCLPLLPPTFFWENVLEKRLYFLRTQATAYATGTSTFVPSHLQVLFYVLGPGCSKDGSLSTRLITIQWIGMRKMNCAIQWIEIYLKDSVIYLLNNWDQVIV